ncbi:hypothetical protein ACFL1S_00655 [Pseudomonadota bacterium]
MRKSWRPSLHKSRESRGDAFGICARPFCAPSTRRLELPRWRSTKCPVVLDSTPDKLLLGSRAGSIELMHTWLPQALFRLPPGNAVLRSRFVTTLAVRCAFQNSRA